MDPFSFLDDLLHQELFWTPSTEPLELPPLIPSLPVSSFIPYVEQEVAAPPIYPLGGRNIHRRLIGFLRSTTNPVPKCSAGGEGRGFRHMMRERQRRDKLSQSYSDLYSMLSPKSKVLQNFNVRPNDMTLFLSSLSGYFLCHSKADKISIVQSAAMYVRELKGVEHELRRRNEEIKARLSSGAFRDSGERVRIQVTKSPSAIESLIGALRCLQSMGVKATGIHSVLSDHELSAVVNVETCKTSTAELERAVGVALMEVEENFRPPFMLSNNWSPNRHVENKF